MCTEVACKEYMVSFTPKHRIKLLKEINCLKKLNHPNNLQHFGIDFTRSLLVTELLEKIIEIEGEKTKIHNARELLDLHEFKPVPWDVRLKVMPGLHQEFHSSTKIMLFTATLKREIYLLVEVRRANG